METDKLTGVKKKVAKYLVYFIEIAFIIAFLGLKLTDEEFKSLVYSNRYGRHL